MSEDVDRAVPLSAAKLWKLWSLWKMWSLWKLCKLWSRLLLLLAKHEIRAGVSQMTRSVVSRVQFKARAFRKGLALRKFVQQYGICPVCPLG